MKDASRAFRFATLLAFAGIGAAYAGDQTGDRLGSRDFSSRPAFLTGEWARVEYNGVTAGLHTGSAITLLGTITYTLPVGAEPTPETLRTLQIKGSYAGLIDLTPGGGFYGGFGFGAISAAANKGVEYRGVADNGSGRVNVSIAVQIPSNFDPAKACIIAAPSSGSRGLYGAAPTTGEWALNKGCAVAYTDKGTGVGAHDLDTDLSYAIDGLLTPAGLRSDLTFNARLTSANIGAYRNANPHRFAVKHLHSQQNPEQDWGTYTLQAIRAAFHALNREYPKARLNPSNTIVIASSVSNGGGASIRAAEQDKDGLITAVVVSEPQVNMPDHARISVSRGGRLIANAGKPLYDYFTYANLLQPCAALAPGLPRVFTAAALAANRCAALEQAGVISGATPAAQAADALAKLHDYGWEPESDILHDSHYGFEFTSLVATAYASAYARTPVSEPICGYSVGGVNALGTTPAAPDLPAQKVFWATGSGLAAGILAVINDNAVGGPAKDTLSITPSTLKADYNVDGALCLRRLATGAAVGNSMLSAAERRLAEQVRNGISKVRVDGDLHGKPTIIVQGRADTLLPVNHASRPYAALNSRTDRDSRLHYYEVTDANHFDAIVTFYPRVLVPLHVYGLRALDLMYAHLTTGASLPPSQVVRAQARTSALDLLTATNVPPISAVPGVNSITIGAGAINVPD
ncbi:MAG: D-(-)-3-hydroxybutyrate oligomer hydrolase [Burkholderia sp.]|nr:D-(-)-3-hydroxybutyrate oligomer hydrolase [Burkholderia sp.]